VSFCAPFDSVPGTARSLIFGSYVAESTAMLSYPKAHERGKFLGIWVSMRNSGEVVGGIVSLCTNIGEHNSPA
jgi:sugar phosphate permease